MDRPGWHDTFLQAVRHYLLAVQFFTRIPVTGRLADWVGFSPAAFRASAAHFPGVGWLMGCLLVGVWMGVNWLFQGVPGASWLAAWWVVACAVWVTGGFHEDGLGDLTDGLGGSHDRLRALEIMKDSRIGSFGALALIMALLGRVLLLGSIGAVHVGWAALALWLAQVASRTWPLGIIRSLPHVGDAAGSKSKPLADQISGASLAVGLVWLVAATLAVVAVSPTWGWGVALLASAASAWWMQRLLRRRLQGFTGDGLGATQQVSEIAFYVGLLVAWRLGLSGVSPWTSG